MPVVYATDTKRRRIRIAPTEPVTLPELTATIDRQFYDGMWTFGVFVDLRLIHRPTSPADVQGFAAHLRGFVEQHGPRGPVAIVAREPEALRAATTYAHFSGRPDPRVEVFWSTEDADAWLDQVAGPPSPA